ncbi:MAG TPA: VWA domain-containing protein [Vicinamibacterales bacterium]
MRRFVLVLGCVALSTSLSGQGQQSQPQQPQPQQAQPQQAQPQQAQAQDPTPTFRTGVDVIAVDVSVTDNRGRPVEDLLAPDFVVKIDGAERRVISAELIKIDVESARRQRADPFDPVFTTNQTPPNGRMIMLAVDQLHVRTGSARGVLQAAARFVDSLSPADRVGFVAYPAPGPVVDFTDDRLRVKRAMQSVVGTQLRFMSKFNIGLSEAIDISERADDRVLFIVISRECRGLRGQALDECGREVVVETSQMVARVRDDREASLRALRGVLEDLARIDGPKTLVLMSEGLVLDDPSELNDIVRLAGLGRVTINVLLMDVPFADATQAVAPPTGREDRQLETSGMADLAASTRGTLFNVIGTGDSIFERIASQTSAFYLLGVEEAAGDRDGKRHRIDVEVRRRAVTLHSRRAFVLSSAAEARRTPEDNLADALRSPFAVAELPIRATTFVTQDSGSGKVRLMVAAEVGTAGSKPAPYTLGYALVDRDGEVVGAFSERRTLTPADGRATAALEYISSVVVDPGIYQLRLAAVDSDGRRGSVVHAVNAWQLAGELFAFGDLFVGNMPESGVTVRPGVEPHVDNGALAAFIELYSSAPATLGKAQVTFEIASDQDGPPLASSPATLVGDAQAPRRVAQAAVEAAVLPPGRYVARAKIAYDGKPAGVLIRPFVLGTLRAGAIVNTGPVKLGDIARFERSAVVAPAVVSGMLDTIAARGPAVKDALTEARAGRYGAAALEALTAGDQTVAQFMRGLELYMKGQLQQAAVQLDLAAGPRREFFPASFFLGAAYAEAGRDREAAGVWQLALGSEPRPSAAYAMLADARFRDGQPQSVVDVLKPAYDRTPNDDQIARRLGLAYVVLGRYADAVPVLDRYLSRNATDQDALFAVIYSTYEATTAAKLLLPEADRAKIKRYASAYKGPQQALVARYLQSLAVR